MAFEDTDLIAVGRGYGAGGTNYKETYGNKDNIEDNDWLMTEATTTEGGRSIGTKYRCSREDWDSAPVYNVGQASQSGTIVTGSGTSWTSAMVGRTFNFASSPSAGIITSFSNSSSLEVTVTQSVGSLEDYYIVGGTSNPVAGDLLLVERPVCTTACVGVQYEGQTTLTVGSLPAEIPAYTRVLFEGASGGGQCAEFILSSTAAASATSIYSSNGLRGDDVDEEVPGGVLYKAARSEWFTDIHSANYGINPITTMYGEPSDNGNNYSVVEVQAEFSSSAATADGDLYIGFRNSAGTGGPGSSTYAYYGDLPIAVVQILQSDGTTVRRDAGGYYPDGYLWNFAISYSDWWTTDSSMTSPATIITDITKDPEDYTSSPAIFTSIGTTASSGIRRFSYTTTGTTSANVGAGRGIPSTGSPKYTDDYSTTSILPVGSANVAQSSTSTDGYLFSECSSTQTGNITWLWVDSLTGLHNGDRIRICYFGGGNGPTPSNGLKTTNTLYIRFKEAP